MSFADDDEVDEVDAEWRDFAKALEAFREKRAANNMCSFYPCPPPVEEYDTMMYGRYTRELGAFARAEAAATSRGAVPTSGGPLLTEKPIFGRSHGACWTHVSRLSTWLWKHTFAPLGEDWLFLALLGLIMALISFTMDCGISLCTKARFWLYKDLATHALLRYLAWVTMPVLLILFSAGFVHVVAPQSIGSGIPEMKTILRGVALKEYLTTRTMIAKVVGLTATLGSGLPLGKEGPSVHIASIVATLMSKLVTSFKGIYENESRNSEMLAAACAVGVASCFASPIGGVLFSIEVTTVYFAVRNYWRAFFAAVCGATAFRLLAVWLQKEATVTAIFGTNFMSDFPFDPQEILVFALIGAISGLGGAFYVWLHRQYVLFMRRNKRMTSFLQKNRFLYPGLVTLLVSSVSFPLGLGQFMAGDLNSHDQVSGLFTNFTWTKSNFTVQEAEVVRHWRTEYTGVFCSLIGYTIFTFFFSIICSTIPVPSGSFIPVFKVGAALGRLFGESMHLLFPYGVRYGGHVTPIVPGGYATVGAAAFSGAVTHSISVSVIVFEMTGQITHIVPIMIAVLISNAIAALLQPSLYDSIILIKKLPYLPDLLPSGSGMYSVYVEDFMLRDVKYIWHGMNYTQLKEILRENRTLRGFPLVDSPDSMVLLGSIQRLELIKALERQVGRERRLQVIAQWQKEAQERAKEEMERKMAEELQKQRRPSRFEVIPAPDILKFRQGSDQLHQSSNTLRQPTKSILKKTRSFTLRGFNNSSPLTSPGATPYTTVTGAESRIRLAFEAIFKKSETLQDVNPDPESGRQSALEMESEPMLTPTSPRASKKVQLPRERVIDMAPEEQQNWEESQLCQPVDFQKCQIDPAPFQLVERTSLLKVHSLFSMVGVNHAYVTTIGRIVGVVGLKELRKAIEDANAGNLPKPTTTPTSLPTESTTNSPSTNTTIITMQENSINNGSAGNGTGLEKESSESST